MNKLIFAFITFLAVNAQATLTNVDKQEIKNIDLLQNSGFENGLAGWTASAGSFSKLTGSNALVGSASARFNASASGQTVCSKLYTIPKGMYGLPALGFIKYITTEATNKYKLSVYDGSSNKLSELTLDSTSVAINGYVPFNSPSSGSVKMCIESTGDSADIDFDFAHLGSDNRLADVTQAKSLGSLKWYTSSGSLCSWSNTSSNFTSFSPIATCPSPEVTGSVSAPATKVPAIVIPSAQPGIYQFIFKVANRTSGGGTLSNKLRVTDGVTNGPIITNLTNGSSVGVTYIYEKIVTSTQTNLKVEIQCAINGGTGSCYIGADGVLESSEMEISALYYPSGSETAVRVDQLGWKVDANITGASPSLGTSTLASYTPIENASLTLTNANGNGNITAKIPCSSTNSPTGTTCASGNESVGVNFDLPVAGDVLACATFSAEISTAVSGDSGLVQYFRIGETNSNSQTVLQYANKTETVITRASGLSVSVSTQNSYPVRLCGTISFASSGNKTLRLLYKQSTVGVAPTGAVITNSSDGEIRWQIFPLNYLSGAMPIFKGMVTSNTSGKERIERATIVFGATPTISKTSSSWITAGTRHGVGDNSFTINGFSQTPVCSCTGYTTAADTAKYLCDVVLDGESNVNLRLKGLQTGTGVAFDIMANVICMGQQ